MLRLEEKYVEARALFERIPSIELSIAEAMMQKVKGLADAYEAVDGINVNKSKTKSKEWR